MLQADYEEIDDAWISEFHNYYPPRPVVVPGVDFTIATARASDSIFIPLTNTIYRQGCGLLYFLRKIEPDWWE